ncbi:Ig-like domain-containing protein [Janibacter sp. CX7]|uniref:L,D-transpeptidase n=1 Tax=Janibacter sp. CX7 TaxID=2963431 RepID=UPI0020CF9539|nr:Ig-like domain-containing protein [Janibacter sp. CX7]UTT67369.1 Ig-like domain-containing protein [Janibacter sp. CX7]
MISALVRPLRMLALALVIVLALAACAGGGSDSPTASQSSAGSTTTTTPDLPEAEVKVNPGAGAKDVMPDAEISVQVMRGSLDRVQVTGPGGASVDGDVSGQTWTSTSRMRPATTYTVAVTAEGPEGGSSTQRSTFTTHDPEITATYGIVYDGQTVGVGMPVSIQFDTAVTEPAYRKKIEQAVSVTTTPKVEGSWGWLDNRQLMWRPKDFWAPGTQVSVDAPLTGFQTGEDKWIAEDLSGSMTIGREQISHVDIAKHKMTVSRAGQQVKSFPVSSGRPGKETETRSGMKVVINKQREMTMDSSTIGIDKGEPGYYKVDTDYNVRVTWTGEFVHSAPWSVGAQGSSNVSHGCVNMAPGNAEWFYDNSLPGDPVDFTGSSRQFQPSEGIGVWQYSWADWQAQSALS